MVVSAVLIFSSFIVFISGQSPGDLRLWRKGVSSLDISSGRLQIFVAWKWYEVCDDGFGRNEADVACHQLGFIGSVYEEAGSGVSDSNPAVPDDLADIILSDVYCPSSEYLHLLRCSYRMGQHFCSGKGYVRLTCNSTHVWDIPYQGQIRLMHGNYTSRGLAQIYCHGRWGTICTNYPFGKTEADTVCRQLGYTAATNYRHLNLLQESESYPILLSDVKCPTQLAEQCLGACQMCSGKIDRSCNHLVDLSIECRFDTLYYQFGSNVSTCEYPEKEFVEERPCLGEVRLYPHTNSPSGIAELFYDSSASSSGSRSWSRICVTGSGSSDQYTADTFCTQLGYSGASSFSSVSTSSHSLSHVSLSCSQRLPHLLWCEIEPVAKCNSSLSVNCYNNSSAYYTGQVRLRGGDYPSEGRVEIYIYGVWSSISIVYFYHYQKEADSVCRQLGYTGAISYEEGAIPGTGSIHVITPSCLSVTNCLSQCLTPNDLYYKNDNYFHNQDLSVNCSFNSSLSVTVGSKTACKIDEPLSRFTSASSSSSRPPLSSSPSSKAQPSHSSDSVELALAATLPCLFILILCVVALMICYCILYVRKASRTPRHKLLKPDVVSSVELKTQKEGDMVPAKQVLHRLVQVQTQTEEEGKEKSPPTSDFNEYFPVPASISVPDPTSV